MSKTSVNDGDIYEKVHSEISRCGDVTSGYEVELTNYLGYLPSQNDVIVDIAVDEELNERLNDGGLNDYGDNAR